MGGGLRIGTECPLIDRVPYWLDPISGHPNNSPSFRVLTKVLDLVAGVPCPTGTGTSSAFGDALGRDWWCPPSAACLLDLSL